MCVIVCAIMMDDILPCMSLWDMMSKFLFQKQAIKIPFLLRQFFCKGAREGIFDRLQFISFILLIFYRKKLLILKTRLPVFRDSGTSLA